MHGRLQFVSYPGVFAHGRLDEGTAMLVDALADVEHVDSALDFGCGSGVIGATILQAYPSACVDLLDVFAPATQAAAENVPGARVILGDGFSALAPFRYRLIASNPPIHTGKGQDFRVLTRFVEQSREYLRTDGQLMIVVQRTVPMRNLFAATYPVAEVLRESNRYRVWVTRQSRSP
ncbi:MAG: methyltransferase [candidate division WOR-3 bacterium]|nr:methyltransferase [candidate division WOR-3 bacterium]